MLRTFVSLARFTVIIASGFYLYSRDPDGAQCDQTCVDESAEEP